MLSTLPNRGKLRNYKCPFRVSIEFECGVKFNSRLNNLKDNDINNLSKSKYIYVQNINKIFKPRVSDKEVPDSKSNLQTINFNQEIAVLGSYKRALIVV